MWPGLRVAKQRPHPLANLSRRMATESRAAKGSAASPSTVERGEPNPLPTTLVGEWEGGKRAKRRNRSGEAKVMLPKQLSYGKL
ncbi:hypothetical protein PCCS19_50420 [Paenibacillus sp. CCS19]|uniref:hypothetical protein n=1 Tax=Paenibacillus sp. CCS19 TaxID=3158387 RepID=UPI00256B5C22|nr:hypothetical protein [Paenibacillus cellulosilyticus]GMK41983.1 hypothetical protein PCCS19_50420 [Paenibacillus cellulosilyticus]